MGPQPSSLLSRYVGFGLLLVLSTAVISGVSNFVNLYAVQGTNSAAFVTVRNALVAALLIPLALTVMGAGARVPLRRADWLRLVTIGVIGGGIPFLLFFEGLQLATVSGAGVTASFLYRSLFLVAAVLGIVVLHERFHWRVAVAAILLLGGNLLLLSLTSPIWANGDAYVFGATGLWALEYTLSKRTLRDLPSGTVALGRMGFGAIFLFLYLGATSQLGAAASLSGMQWEWVVVSAALLTAFVATWYAGLRHVDLGVATAVLVVGFPVTWLLSVLVRGAAFTEWEVVGAIAVATGAVVFVGRTTLRSTWEFLRSPPLRRPSS
jgi:drug/metabolite transporter (DMT)-like permease